MGTSDSRSDDGRDGAVVAFCWASSEKNRGGRGGRAEQGWGDSGRQGSRGVFGFLDYNFVDFIKFSNAICLGHL